MSRGSVAAVGVRDWEAVVAELVKGEQRGVAAKGEQRELSEHCERSRTMEVNKLWMDVKRWIWYHVFYPCYVQPFAFNVLSNSKTDLTETKNQNVHKSKIKIKTFFPHPLKFNYKDAPT